MTEVWGFNLISRVLSALSPGAREVRWGGGGGGAGGAAREGTNLRMRLLTFLKQNAASGLVFLMCWQLT